jgi:hypothetical protein
MNSSTSSISESAPGPSPVGAGGPAPSDRAGRRRFAAGPLTGEIRDGLTADAAELLRVIDPAAAQKTIHWGRNYLYQAQLADRVGALAVVVKVYRESGARRRIGRRWKGNRAQRSFDASTALLAAGVPVPRPVAALETAGAPATSFFLYEPLDAVIEARYFFRARNARSEREHFPAIDGALVLERIAAVLRRMHDAHLWHRDVSAGNVLLAGDWSGRGEPGQRIAGGTTVPASSATPSAGGAGDPVPTGEVYLIDLARTRIGKPLTLSERMRDLARLPLHRAEDRAALLESYAGRRPRALERGLFAFHHHAFHLRHRLKNRLRGLQRAARGLVSRGTHPHIPPAQQGAAVRDRVVWDPLSDQPHLHAGRTAKLRTRLADAGIHGREAALLVRRLPAIAARYRTLRRELHDRPVSFGEAGVGLHGGSAPAERLIAEVEALGVRRVLLRLQPWENELDRDAGLARELVERGKDVLLAVAQNRDLVRDLPRWRAALDEIAARFGGLASHVQIGHAINRSKWGIWNQREYADLVRTAVETFAGRGPGGSPAFAIVGPGVIDFELYATCIALEWPENPVRFDAVTSLLYVDRRGAPENRQAGLDAQAKALLLRATIQTSRHGDRESWITEVNWPLHEGPHSPAGRHVSVSEDAQASYLARYHLLLLGSGVVERAYWWQLAARGYGLADVEPSGLRRRPSWHALAFLHRALGGTRACGPLPSTPPLLIHAFERDDGGCWLVAWSANDRPVEWRPPASPRRLFDRAGTEIPIPASATIAVAGAPVYAEYDELPDDVRMAFDGQAAVQRSDARAERS